MTGIASFYDFGTTAMRDVPRGTTIVICGAGGCIERVVTDYGPSKAGGRLIDMYRPDFFKICGCGWWSGTTTVTVRVVLARYTRPVLHTRPESRSRAQ